MKSELTDKINVLDSLRGFAAISVCLFHFVYTTLNFIDDGDVKNFFLPGMYGVTTFFVISGFIIPYAMFNAGYKFSNFFSFFAKRLLRLEPLYICSLSIAVIILFGRSYFLKPHIQPDVNLKQIALHFGYLIPFFKDYKWLNEVYWTLAVEFQYYIFIALLFVPLIKIQAWGRWIFYSCMLGLSFIANYTFLPNNLPFFQLGILLFLYKIEVIRKTEFVLALGFTIIFVLFRYEFAAVPFVLIPLVAILFFQDYKLKGFHQLGKFSYSIYLMHPLIGSTIINVLSHHAKSSFHKIGIVILGLLVTLGASWITYWLIEKPTQKLSKSIVYGR